MPTTAPFVSAPISRANGAAMFAPSTPPPRKPTKDSAPTTKPCRKPDTPKTITAASRMMSSILAARYPLADC